ncbi:nucleotide-binding domain containing protein [Peribacillus aracenensis]|uniref:nucleotide-binding domain containing protein n=1 Tax=Peribacillus aracenensis TaxID=2976708 RepID=UPI0021A53DCE|nr:nucleotide-binding domain containing protein [Peribacillus sp. BBB004]
MLAVAGSATPITKTQLKALLDKECACQIPISVEALIDKKETAPLEIQRVVAKTIKTVESQKPNIVVLETALSANVLTLSAKEGEFGLNSGEAANNINAGFWGNCYPCLKR